MSTELQRESVGGFDPRTGSAVHALIAAARELLEKGGSITRRTALAHALNAIEFSAEIKEQPPIKRWQFTPAAKWVLCRAAKRASMERDDWIRTLHIAAALQDLPNDQAQAQPPTATPERKGDHQ
jgi:hypothetical protein